MHSAMSSHSGSSSGGSTLLIYSLYIINKAGGLIYQKVRCAGRNGWRGSDNDRPTRMSAELAARCSLCRVPCVQDFSSVPKLSTNDYLRLASTFHSLHAITARGIHIVPAQDRRTAAAAQAAAQAPDALPKNQEGIHSLEAKVSTGKH